MAKTDIKIIWTLEGVKAHLLAGMSPRDIGGADALAGRRPPAGIYLPAFLREVHTRAEGLGHIISEWAQDQFEDIASALRSNPFATDPAMHQAHAEPTIVGATINRHLEHDIAELIELRNEADAAGTVYRRDLQAANATHPRGGWKDAWNFGALVGGIVTIETGIATVVLWPALGLIRATVTGAAFALVSLGGGFASGLALLRPVKKECATPLHRAGQWTLAIVAGSITAGLLYVGACYRSAWIDGLNGEHADVIRKFLSPGEVLIDFDVVTLAALGVTGFWIGAREFFNFYHGYRSLLRNSGIAKANVEGALREKADELKAFVQQAGADGITRVEDIVQNDDEWVRAVANHADNAVGIRLDANRRLDVVRRAFSSVVAQYMDGFDEVAPAGARSEIAYSAIGSEIEVPDLFVKVRAAAIEAAAQVADSVRAAKLEISNTVISAVGRIDEIAGLRPRAAGVAMLPPT